MNQAEKLRIKAQQKWPGSSVHARGKTWIRHQHPTEPNRFMLDASISAIHYGLTENLEIDTAWETSVDPAWQWQMIKADYNTYARNQLNAGDVVKYIHSTSGEYVIFQPLALNWVDNVTDSRQQITQPQTVLATPVDDLLRWENGYGAGRHFSWKTQASRLQKLITIDNLTDLPAPTVSNPYLEIEFIIKKSANVAIYIDGVLWDETTKTATVNRVEYKHTGTGEVLWVLDYPGAFDSSDAYQAGIFQLRRQAANRYCTVRIPKTWIDTAAFPIHIDPTIDVQIGATANDGFRSGSGFFTTLNNNGIGFLAGVQVNAFLRYTNITVSGTVSVCYIDIDGSGTDTIALKVFFQKEDNPSAPTDTTTFDNQIADGTTAKIDWDVSESWSYTTWYNSPDLSTSLQELIDTYTISGDAVIVFIQDDGSGTNMDRAFRDYTYSSAQAAYLYVEYSTGTNTSSNKGSYTKGQTSTSGNKPAYLRGSDSITSGKLAYSSGSENVLDASSVYTHGLANTLSSKSAHTSGHRLYYSREATGYGLSFQGQWYGMPWGEIPSALYLRGETDDSEWLEDVYIETIPEHEWIYPEIGDFDEYEIKTADFMYLPGDYKIYWRAKRIDGTLNIKVKCEIREDGEILVSNEQTLSSSWQTFIYTLTLEEVSSITNFNNLRVRFTVTDIFYQE